MSDDSKEISILEYPYPNLYKFVKQNVLPDELARIKKVVKLYANLILENLRNVENPDINSVIYSISPFPGWLDPGASNVWNGATEQLEHWDLAADLKSALEKDGINIVVINPRKERQFRSSCSE